jgi:hypothetical protein
MASGFRQVILSPVFLSEMTRAPQQVQIDTCGALRKLSTVDIEILREDRETYPVAIDVQNQLVFSGTAALQWRFQHGYITVYGLMIHE